MKRPPFLFLTWLLLSILINCLVLQVQAQNKLPPFSMLLSNGKTFSTEGLSLQKPTLLIYFAPDCDHCQTLMKAFFKKAVAFKNTQVLMVTFKPVADLNDFEKSYRTQKHPNIYVGAETKPLYLQAFYKLQNTPFTALYDKSKNLVASYKKDTTVTDLIKRLKSLK
jgi:peroxiredoxin